MIFLRIGILWVVVILCVSDLRMVFSLGLVIVCSELFRLVGMVCEVVGMVWCDVVGNVFCWMIICMIVV